MRKKQNPLKNEFLKHIGLITQLGTSVVLTIVLCVLGFNYLDELLNAGGILKIAGVLLGVFLAMFTAYRQLKKYYKE